MKLTYFILAVPNCPTEYLQAMLRCTKMTHKNLAYIASKYSVDLMKALPQSSKYISPEFLCLVSR